jgi:hypothetical protein
VVFVLFARDYEYRRNPALFVVIAVVVLVLVVVVLFIVLVVVVLMNLDVAWVNRWLVFVIGQGCDRCAEKSK